MPGSADRRASHQAGGESPPDDDRRPGKGRPQESTRGVRIGSDRGTGETGPGRPPDFVPEDVRGDRARPGGQARGPVAADREEWFMSCSADEAVAVRPEMPPRRGSGEFMAL